MTCDPEFQPAALLTTCRSFSRSTFFKKEAKTVRSLTCQGNLLTASAGVLAMSMSSCVIRLSRLLSVVLPRPGAVHDNSPLNGFNVVAHR